jgi:Transposase
MTKGRVEVITSVERRRRFSSAEKQQLVSASLEPGASVSAVAREAGIHPGSSMVGGGSWVSGRGSGLRRFGSLRKPSQRA